MKNKKGFTLVEVLVVSIFIITTLVFLFTQFINLKKSYDNILVYNTVDGLYGTKNINDYLNTSNLMMKDIINTVDKNDYIDISDCSKSPLIYENFCNSLYNSLDVKKVIVTHEDLVEFKKVLKNNNDYSDNLKQYINKTTVKGFENSYRLIVEYNNNNISSIIMEVRSNE